MRYLILSLIMSFAVQAYAQSSFYKRVSTMWYAGDSQGVLEIANQRLAHNSNDLAGLLLKFQWHGEHLQFAGMHYTMSQVLEVGATYPGTNFAKEYPSLREGYEMLIPIIRNYPLDEYAKDILKTNIPCRTMDCDAALKALQDDGYFQQQENDIENGAEQSGAGYPPQGVGSPDP